jgi:hypothetical protein
VVKTGGLSLARLGTGKIFVGVIPGAGIFVRSFRELFVAVADERVEVVESAGAAAVA